MDEELLEIIHIIDDLHLILCQELGVNDVRIPMELISTAVEIVGGAKELSEGLKLEIQAILVDFHGDNYLYSERTKRIVSRKIKDLQRKLAL